ncbi:MAG TPA: molybdopterin converting factor subunit 1 [Pirellulaceae bacterium]|nr:molybdopterin converting factor subunit 1 [Pirellulaceae bacterium]
MKLCVKLFAVAKERLGQNSIEIELPEQATVGMLRSSLVEQHPQLAEVMRHTRLAVNSEYATDEAAIPARAEVALIPPVSGG